jgi:hypothetical protein
MPHVGGEFEPGACGSKGLIAQGGGMLTATGGPLSALGHKRKWCHACVMSVLPLKADVRRREWQVDMADRAESPFAFICEQAALLLMREARYVDPP